MARRGVLITAIGVAVAVWATAGLASPSGPVYQPPRSYYLALGDSLTYGLQPGGAGDGTAPATANTGFVGLFDARLRTLSPRITVVNFGCPGESTTTFTAGGCPWIRDGRTLHDAFRGSQMKAALTFLAEHPHQVSPITVTLWANDVIAFSNTCKGQLACIKARAPRAIDEFAGRLTVILSRLRKAAPDAEIIVAGAWNDQIADLAATNELYQSLDAAIARSAASARARHANVLPRFNPPGSIPRQRARLCALTFICSQDDGHPTNAGYKTIADVFLAASGYHPR